MELPRRVVRGLLRHRVIGPYHLEGLAVSGRPVKIVSFHEGPVAVEEGESSIPCVGNDNVVERSVGPPETGESDLDHHGCWARVGRWGRAACAVEIDEMSFQAMAIFGWVQACAQSQSERVTVGSVDGPCSCK